MIGPLARRAPGRTVRWGTLRRMRPFSAHYGWERGDPVDRHYIDAFIGAHVDAIRGDVLEVREPRYGRVPGASATQVHVVDIDTENPEATLNADLTAPGSLPASAYDCVVLTQTLQFLDDADAALSNLRLAMRPSGTLLLTVPCVSKIDHESPEADYWRWTPCGLRLVLQRAFPEARVDVEGHGNLLTSLAFLLGLAQAELTEHELAHADSTFPLVACARVDKPAATLP